MSSLSLLFILASLSTPSAFAADPPKPLSTRPAYAPPDFRCSLYGDGEENGKSCYQCKCRIGSSASAPGWPGKLVIKAGFKRACPVTREAYSRLTAVCMQGDN